MATCASNGAHATLPVSCIGVEYAEQIVIEVQQASQQPLPERRTTAWIAEQFPDGAWGSIIRMVRTCDPSGMGSYSLPVINHRDLHPNTFAMIRSLDIPFMVQGLLSELTIRWDAQYFIRHHGNMECKLVDTKTDAIISSTLGSFFKSFGDYNGRISSLKLKVGVHSIRWHRILCINTFISQDCPDSDTFQHTFPSLFDDFINAVPAPDYIRHDGMLNIAAHFDINDNAPDLGTLHSFSDYGLSIPAYNLFIGPKLYAALESSELPGYHGTTRLHADAADAINIMTAAYPRMNSKPGYAAWNIFRKEDVGKVRDFIRETCPDFGYDPIHSHRVFLDNKLRRDLRLKKNVLSWRIHQMPGDAIFLPAGYVHQVSDSSRRRCHNL